MKRNVSAAEPALELGLVLVLGGVCVWYVSSTFAASSDMRNIILILPVGVVTAVLLALLALRAVWRIVMALRITPATASRADPRPEAGPQEGGMRVFVFQSGIFILFAAFCLSMDIVGFDVATYAFVLAGLLLLGERRLLPLVLFPPVFTVVVIQMMALTSFGLPVFFTVLGR